MTTDDSSSLQILEDLELNDRREAVAKDLHQGTQQFSGIPAHELADVLEVPVPYKPDNDWGFICYAPIVSVEEWAQWNEPASDVFYLIEKSVSAPRFQELLKQAELLDGTDNPRFDFLLEPERCALERAIAKQTLTSNLENGVSCVARCSVKSESGVVLEFEGDIEDDGACIHLRTPYDKRAMKFQDLSGCVTKKW